MQRFCDFCVCAEDYWNWGDNRQIAPNTEIVNVYDKEDSAWKLLLCVHNHIRSRRISLIYQVSVFSIL